TVGVAVRCRVRADLASVGPRSCGGRQGGQRRAVAAEGLRNAQGRRERRGAVARGLEGAREATDRDVEVPALDRFRREPAEDRDGEDSEVQVEGLTPPSS